MLNPQSIRDLLLPGLYEAPHKARLWKDYRAELDMRVAGDDVVISCYGPDRERALPTGELGRSSFRAEEFEAAWDDKTLRHWFHRKIEDAIPARMLTSAATSQRACP